MDKKVVTILVITCLIVIGVGGFFLINNQDKKAEPINKDGKSLVVYFSVPETDDPDKKMTTEEENSAIVVDGKVLGNTQYAAI